MNSRVIFSLLFFVFSSTMMFAQSSNTKDEIITEIKQKSFYFQNIVGEIEVNKEGVLLLNGVKLDMKNLEVGYQTSAEGDNFIYFLSANPEYEFEAWNGDKLLFKTNNIIHLMHSKEQAVELVVLFNLLKSFYAS